MVRGKCALQHVFQIGTLAVLNIIDVPTRLGADAFAVDKLHQATRVFDITGLHRGDENGVDPRHRDHPNLAGERPIGFRHEDLLQLGRDLAGHP